jgi:hypothetical protein
MASKFIFTIVVATVLLSSCNHKTEDKYLKTFDSLHVVLIQTDSIYKTIDWQKAIEVEATLKTNIASIESSKKKLKNEERELLETYKKLLLFGGNELVQEQGSAFDQQQKKKFLRKQIDYSFSQLENLKADVESNSLKDDKIKAYIHTERNAIVELYKFTSQKSVIYNTCFSQFELMKPQIEEILNKAK